MGCYIWYGEEGPRPGCGPAQAHPRCTKCNIPPINGQCNITLLLYDGRLLCGFNVAIKGLMTTSVNANNTSQAVALNCTASYIINISPQRAIGERTRVCRSINVQEFCHEISGYVRRPTPGQAYPFPLPFLLSPIPNPGSRRLTPTILT